MGGHWAGLFNEHSLLSPATPHFLVGTWGNGIFPVQGEVLLSCRQPQEQSPQAFIPPTMSLKASRITTSYGQKGSLIGAQSPNSTSGFQVQFPPTLLCYLNALATGHRAMTEYHHVATLQVTGPWKHSLVFLLKAGTWEGPSTASPTGLPTTCPL